MEYVHFPPVLVAENMTVQKDVQFPPEFSTTLFLGKRQEPGKNSAKPAIGPEANPPGEVMDGWA